MPHHYTDPSRETDPHALPNVEAFYVGTLPIRSSQSRDGWKQPLPCHICADWSSDEQTPHGEHVGWYWAPGFPGCLRDSDPIGPFDTEAEALADAREA